MVAFRDGRIQFSMLAMLFAIIADYDGDVRWKDAAPVARDRFSSAGFNSKVGSLQAFNEAADRKLDLEQLIRGGGLEASSPPTATDWEKVCERPPLMLRLKRGFNEGINTWSANSGSFRQHADDILREAELIAAIAEAMQQEGFDLWDDETYVEYCDQLKQGALAVATAVRQQDAQAGRQASGVIAKACDNCHGDYR